MSEDVWKRARRPRATAPAAEQRPSAAARSDARPRELRLHGLNAVRALFAASPERLRKLYIAEAQVPVLRDLLKWCAQHRVGYRVVAAEDLARLAQTQHHEGVVADVVPAAEVALADWLSALDPEAACCALWLDGVGNPHNLGAIMRNAAHFNVTALLVTADAVNPVSGAAARVAEGGAERVQVVRLPSDAKAGLTALREAGFQLAATLVQGGEDLYAVALPSRLVYVMGAEQHGMHKGLAQACDLRVSIPGSGAVESLNVASATAVFLGEWYRRHRI